MPRPGPGSAAAYYQRYIDQAPGNDVNKLIQEQTKDIFRFFSRIPADKRNYRYANGKWTIQELIQHLIDTERVFAYRALCIARQDKTPLPSFDEDLYALHSKAAKRDWKELLDEFRAVRTSTVLLFQSFGKKELNTIGTASNQPVSVLAIGFILAGHVNHHIRILKERYF